MSYDNQPKDCNEIKKMRNIIIVIAAAIIVVIYFTAFKTNDISSLQKQISPTASIYKNPKTISGVLINDNGVETTLSTVDKDKWLLLYFGYANCPDVCPVDLAIINQSIAKMKQKEKIQLVFISIDTERDKGSLTDFVGKFNPNFKGFIAKDLAKLSRSLGVYYEVETIKKHSTMKSADHSSMDHAAMGHSMDNAKDNYLMNHTASFLLLNPQQEMLAILSSPHYAGKMADALDNIITTLD